MYDPSSTVKKEFLRLCLRVHKPVPELFLCALECTLKFTFKRPRSHLTSKSALRKGVPTLHKFKPDVDNMAKFVMDALNGVYYKDDSQICTLVVSKQYGAEDSVLIQLRLATES